MNKKNISTLFAVLSALLFAGAGCTANVSREVGESGEVKQIVVSDVTSTENVGSASSGLENKLDDSEMREKRNESENENENEDEGLDDDRQTSGVSTNTPAPTKPAPTYTKTVYSMTDVKAANTPEKCWTVVNGVVYDLTAWINRHPGGDKNILSLCGLDGTAAYNSVHASQPKPANVLAGFEIGLLK